MPQAHDLPSRTVRDQVIIHIVEVLASDAIGSAEAADLAPAVSRDAIGDPVASDLVSCRHPAAGAIALHLLHRVVGLPPRRFRHRAPALSATGGGGAAKRVLHRRSRFDRPFLARRPWVDCSVAYAGSTVVIAVRSRRDHGVGTCRVVRHGDFASVAPTPDPAPRSLSVCRRGTVGVDIVSPHPDFDSPTIARLVLSSSEQTALSALAQPHVQLDDAPRVGVWDEASTDDRLLWWMTHAIARKEAVGKLIGWGIGRGLAILPSGMQRVASPPALDARNASCTRIHLPDRVGSGGTRPAIVASWPLDGQHVLAVALRLPSSGAIRVVHHRVDGDRWQTRRGRSLRLQGSVAKCGSSL